jgi:hypothetical protein
MLAGRASHPCVPHGVRGGVPDRNTHRPLLLAAALAAVALAGPGASRADDAAPDLGAVRYRDPTEHRTLWLGFDVGGVVLPEAVGVFDRDVWTARATPAWALALTPRVAAGGRHAMVFYDAENTRLQVHEHQLELSGPLLSECGSRATCDRLAATLEVHALSRTWTDGEAFAIGGVDDTIVGVGYGMSHSLARAWELGWNVQPRFAWVFLDTQRQVRGAVRLLWLAGDGHQLGLEWTAYLVHRDASQFGNPLRRTSVHGQLALEWAAMWTRAFGTVLGAHYATGFMSGQAPMYEVREEAINASYGELRGGIRVAW